MEQFTPLFQAFLILMALIGGLGGIFRILLNPVYFQLEKLKAGQARLEAKIDQLLSYQKENKQAN